MKVTVDLDPDIYRAIKVEAARSDRSVREIVDEALTRGWTPPKMLRTVRPRPRLSRSTA